LNFGNPIAKREGFAFALERLGKDIPEAGKMNPDNFIDNSILLELGHEGFITEITRRRENKGRDAMGRPGRVFAP
jgi:hypothetical protein